MRMLSSALESSIIALRGLIKLELSVQVHREQQSNMSSVYKNGDKEAPSCVNPAAITIEQGKVGEDSRAAAREALAGTRAPTNTHPGAGEVDMEEMVDVQPSINGGTKDRSDLSPSSADYTSFLEATAELSDEEQGKRLINRRHERRELALGTLAHALAAFTGEFVGTFLLTLCIISAVAASVVAEALSGLWQVAVICGLGVALGIYLSAHISDAHLNPAVTVAFAIIRFRVFSWKKVPVYIAAQMLGGFAAGGVLYGTYHNAIASFEEERGIERGLNGSELSGMIFGEYFPNPALFPGQPDITTPLSAFFTEAWATCVLVFVVFAFTDPHNTTVGSGKHKVPVPILIGATVMVLISLYGPLTQAGLNPARDFGPRVFAAMAGWGEVAIPGPRRGFWVYIVGPLCGGLVGGALYDIGAAKAMKFKMKMKTAHSRSQCYCRS